MAPNRSQAAAAALRERIASGELAPGERVGASIKAIAREYSVGPTTMQGVLRDFAAEGLVRRDHGVGYFVAANAADLAQQANGDGELVTAVRKLQEDVADLKADVAELQSRRGIDRRKRERGNEQSG